jgi:transposase
MKSSHWIGLDVHCSFCELAVIDGQGRLVERGRCVTSISAIVAAMAGVPQPRRIVFEEGPLADWLLRNLRAEAKEVCVCDPRRNRLIALDGDKDDPLDAERLARLGQGGYLKSVHHPESLARSVFKQHVQLYHDRVRHRVSESHRLCSLLRRQGIMVRERAIASREDFDRVLLQLPESEVLREDADLLWQAREAALRQECQARKRLVKLAQADVASRRLEALPGVGWIRAATLVAYLDTPWRFPRKQALWRYLGIGLERRRSGTGFERLRVPLRVNRFLKATILGAARSAILQKENPFADQYAQGVQRGLSARLARRTVARSLATVLWSVWKSGQPYQAERVGSTPVAA